ncbi:MAG TPA: DUF3800 domain-containing protein [Solirubrobacterales bacterium]|nr:DUF3800 domain-containing protein [Solirubrobacterales bacterium]
MRLCYVDESGTAEKLVEADPDQQPVIVIAGVSLPESELAKITHDWINLKKRFDPVLAKTGHGWLDAILQEVKGANLRKGFRNNATVRQRKRAIGVLDGTLKLLERYDAKILGRVWMKRLDTENDDMGIHASSLQFICRGFDASLPTKERGMVVVDSQTYQHNHRLAHSLFTQRFGKHPKHLGLVDMPVFGHSDNHAGLQIADLLCSAILAPIASAVYAGSYEQWNKHCQSGYLDIRERFGPRLESLTFHWKHPRTGKTCPSLIVNDPISKRGARLMWGPASASTPVRRTRKKGGEQPAGHKKRRGKGRARARIDG